MHKIRVLFGGKKDNDNNHHRFGWLFNNLNTFVESVLFKGLDCWI